MSWIMITFAIASTIAFRAFPFVMSLIFPSRAENLSQKRFLMHVANALIGAFSYSVLFDSAPMFGWFDLIEPWSILGFLIIAMSMSAAVHGFSVHWIFPIACGLFAIGIVLLNG